jgi:hypothetical protein
MANGQPEEVPKAKPALGYRATRVLLLRGIGAVYVAAYASLAVQVGGLVGSRGILPARLYLERIYQVLGPDAYLELPTIFWLNASDAALHSVCWGGVVVGALVTAGLVPRVGLIVLWAGYLSLTHACQVFLGYQWDSLLLEAGLLAALFAPGGLWLSGARGRPPVAVLWLFRWLVFRLMFLSGVVKIGSGDPTWAAWEALRYHYETQPLPTWTSWYVHQMPGWFHTASVGFMFWAELIAPFLIFGPRPLRWVAFASAVMLQGGILATGNYGFFNVLSIVLCISLLDDREWGWTARRRGEPGEWTDAVGPAKAENPTLWERLRRALLWGAVAVIVLATSAGVLGIVLPRASVPWPMELVRGWVEPLRSTNTYGLFAVMTTKRPEIELEGSDDGLSWTPYRCRWKPEEPWRRPRFTTPHLPRLDWQLWFAALGGHCASEPWFLHFEQRLFEGSPPVLALLRENPFPDHPPRFIRARLYLYKFTGPGARDWWAREEVGLYCPPLEANDLQ